MAERDQIVEFCNDLLKLHEYPDFGPMGLQRTGNERVRKVASAVSASADVINRAGQSGADMLLVHHGLFWKNESALIDVRHERRFSALHFYNISLLGYHLALDAHPKLGNNILAARLLGLGKLTPFEGIGWGGEYQTPRDITNFESLVTQKFPGRCGDWEDPRAPIFFPYGPERVKKVAVIVGGAASYIIAAHREGYDTFLTGEADEQTLALAQDLGMNFIAAGHDATERSGVQKLGAQISKRFGIPHQFITTLNPV